jgi:hypothetical protein
MPDLVDIQKAWFGSAAKPFLGKTTAKRVAIKPHEEIWQTHHTPGFFGRLGGRKQQVGGLNTFSTGRNARVYEVEQGMKEGLRGQRRRIRPAAPTQSVAAPTYQGPEWLR